MDFGVMALGALAALGAAAAPAGDGGDLNLGRMTRGYTYYNWPDADGAKHDADVKACLLAISDMRSAQEGFGGVGVLDALIAGARADSASRGVMSAGIENCMVVRGWRVVQLDDTEGAGLAALPSAELAAKLAPWIGAETPHGQVVRVWHNDAALASVNHFSLHAQHTRNGQLSVLAVGSTVSATLKADKAADRAAPKPERVKLDPKWPKKALKPELLDSAPPGSALIVVNIKGMSLRQGNGFSFNRVGADANVMPSTLDHAPDVLTAFVGTLGTSSGGNFLAFAVPPGRWRINSMVDGIMALNFCLGSPAFDVGAGEVVYVGQLDLKQERLLPGQELAPVRAWMGPAKAVERLRPATFTNGSQSHCASTSIYALEFEGAPFEPGYALGSKARAQ